MKRIFIFLFAAIMWVQVPQWKNDWSKCAVDMPDSSCHWYVASPDNTFGDGFNWKKHLGLMLIDWMILRELIVKQLLKSFKIKEHFISNEYIELNLDIKFHHAKSIK